MSLKYCYNKEIHKAFDLPQNFSSLLEQISSLFVQKLPSSFLLQYQDMEGDRIAITNEQEYQSFVQHEVSKASSTIKIFVVPLCTVSQQEDKKVDSPNDESNGSFEIIDTDDNLKMKEVVEMSSTEQDIEDSTDSKVVISLRIPENSKQEDKVCVESMEKKEEGSECSFDAKYKERNQERSQELSLSLEEDKTVEKEKSLAEESFGMPQASPQEMEKEIDFSNRFSAEKTNDNKESEGMVGERRWMGLLDIPVIRADDSIDLSKSLDGIVEKGPRGQHYDYLEKDLGNNASFAEREEKSREESQDRWMSFWSQREEVNQDQEPTRKNIFTLKQKPEAWFIFNQEKICGNVEREDDNNRENEDRQRICSDSLTALCQDKRVLAELKDEEIEERKRWYQALNEEDEMSGFGSFEGSFKENVGEFANQDLWFELRNPILSKKKNEDQNPNFQTGQNKELKETELLELFYNKGEPKPDEIEQAEKNRETTFESMDMPWGREARYMAPAMRCSNSSRGVNGEVSNQEVRIPNEPDNRVTRTSPLRNKWVCRKTEIELKEIWPFEETKESLKEKESWPYVDMQKEGFCMQCWETPINGPRYICPVCEGVEYCGTCQARVSHCHALVKFGTQIETRQKEMNDIDLMFFQDQRSPYAPKEEKCGKEEPFKKDIDVWERYFTRDQGNYYESDHPKFEYKEISSTPIFIRSNKKEWCVVYKTICLKNCGNSMWVRCHFEPTGLVSGRIAEISCVAPGDSVLLTLEIHGFFAPGKYNSRWRVTHQGDEDNLLEMGSIDLEFEVKKSDFSQLE